MLRYVKICYQIAFSSFSPGPGERPVRLHGFCRQRHRPHDRRRRCVGGRCHGWAAQGTWLGTTSWIQVGLGLEKWGDPLCSCYSWMVYFIENPSENPKEKSLDDTMWYRFIDVYFIENPKEIAGWFSDTPHGLENSIQYLLVLQH